MAKSNPPWSSEEELAFVASCTTDDGKWRSNAAKEKFVNEAMKHNLGLVFSIVNKVAFTLTEDVFQKAMIGMVEALKKYDPKKGRKISTWITNPIRWAVMQHQNAYAKSGTIAEEFSALNRKFSLKMSVVSIDTPVGGEEENEPIGSTISISSLDKNYAIQRSYRGLDELQEEIDIADGVREMLKRLRRYLNSNEIRVIRGLLKGKTQTDIAGTMHLSKVRISQLQASAFDKIRKSPMSRTLRKLIA